MTSGSTPIPTRGPLMPILAIGAAVLAGAVWIVPLPILKPPQAPLAPTQPPVVLPTGEQTAPQPAATEEWAPLTAGLEALREKLPEVPVAEVVNNDPKIDTLQPPTAPAGMAPLGWSFKGTIDGPGSMAALVTFPDGKSRFVFVGQQLPDMNNPAGKPAIVREIAHEYILVDRNGTEDRVPLTRTELTNPLKGRASAFNTPR